MSLPPLFNILSIPLITGIVGYITNKIAIKMLFRPYRPKWYTLGWQGVVPRTKPKLAKKISEVVGQKLVSHEDILPSLSKPEFIEIIRKPAEKKLQEINPEKVVSLLNFLNIEKSVKKNKESINALASSIALKILEKPLSDTFPSRLLGEKLREKLAKTDIPSLISSEIAETINNYIHSGKTLREALPEPLLAKTDALEEYLTKAALDIIKASGRSADAKEIVSEKVADFKNSLFKGSKGDALKTGLLNMFLDDETVKNAVKRELPSILDGIAEEEKVAAKIREIIREKINGLLSEKLSDLSVSAGEELIPSVSGGVAGYMASPEFKEKLENILFSFIDNAASKYGQKSVGEVAESMGVDIPSYVSHIDAAGFLISAEGEELLKDMVRRAADFASKNSSFLSLILAEKGAEMIRNNLEPALVAIDIEKTVEDKINGLPLNEVEDILFSFMREHFKWINILGFAIGFLIGGIQAAFIYFVQ